jgi:ubiquinone/menaquinone biosynthesis C-methylase UbiE
MSEIDFEKQKNSKTMYTDSPQDYFSYDRLNYGYSVFLDPLMDIKEKENKKIYDIGCGGGYWFNLYKRYGFKKKNIVGLDQSATSVLSLKNKGYEVCEGNAIEMPFSDEVSDVTMSNGVIHHTVDSKKAFEELCRITKKHGEIFVGVYNIWHPYFFIVHKLTFPFRYIYWNISRSVYKPVYFAAYLALQAFSLLFLRRLLSKADVKRIVMDQIFTPVAELFSHGKLKKYGQECGVTMLSSGLYQMCFMRYARFRKDTGE